MSTSSTRRAGHTALLVCAVCLIAANMRTTITGVGPLLDQMADDLGTSTTALGALASVPLLAWAAVSPLAHALSARFGMSRVVLLSMVVLGAGTIWRSLPGTDLPLWMGTALIGAALAVANVLMPAVIKRDFGGRVPLMMSVYTAMLGTTGALASGIVVPISAVAGGGATGWRVALASTAALLPPAIALWAWAMVVARRASDVHPPVRHSADIVETHRATGPANDAVTAGPRRRHGTGIWTDPVAWLVAAYMGLQSAAFYTLLTWMAPIATSGGRSAVVAGLDVMLFQLTGIVGALLVPLALRGRARRWIPAAMPVVALISVAGMLAAPSALTLWATVGGLSVGGSLTMALTLMAERARDHSASTALSGMAQSVGYLIAAAGPVAFGALHAFSGGWTAPLLLLAAVLAGQLGVGLAVGRERYVLTAR